MTQPIPFLDLVTPHADLRRELCGTFTAALDSGAFVGGTMVDAFEREFAKYCETQHCIGVSSGTDALRFALMAAPIKPGAIVLTVPHTFIATAEAIVQAGAYPEFVDVDEDTGNMDARKLREYLETECYIDHRSRDLMSRRLRRPVAAIVPVHLYGQMADMDHILAIAAEFGLPVFEDACQAHGAEYYSSKQQRWRKAGSMGKAAAFSFYPGKNLGACGEAGAVTTNDAEMAQIIRMLRDHGQTRKYSHEVQGYNGRLDAIQAGILDIKLRHLNTWNEMRRQAAARYRDLFAGDQTNHLPPYEPTWSKSVYHLYVVRVGNRDGLLKHLTNARIGTGIHYPVPLHLQNAYSYLGHTRGAFPVSENLASHVLSLPMYPQLSAEQQERVAQAVREFIRMENCVPLAESAGVPAAVVY